MLRITKHSTIQCNLKAITVNQNNLSNNYSIQLVFIYREDHTADPFKFISDSIAPTVLDEAFCLVLLGFAMVLSILIQVTTVFDPSNLLS